MFARIKRYIFQRGVGRTQFAPTTIFCCYYVILTEQKARVTYDNILRLTDDPDVRDPIKFLREREIVHYQRFGDCLRKVQERADHKNIYGYNPAFDKRRR